MSLHTYFNQLITQTELSVNNTQTQQLLEFVGLLDKWNRAYNLTSVRSPIHMLPKHILDSLVVHPYLQGHSFIDVGTGPGLPGIPLAILNPDKTFVLLDSLGKRIRFLRQVMYHLQLKNITLVQCRVEQYQPVHSFDGVLSRAFACLKDMLVHCQHLIDVKAGFFYALKGMHPTEELQEVPSRFALQDVIHLQVPGLCAQRHLVIFQKNS